MQQMFVCVNKLPLNGFVIILIFFKRVSVPLAQLFLRFALFAGHLLAAVVLQLFTLVVVRSHFQQPTAVYLNHLQRMRWRHETFILAGIQLKIILEYLTHFLITLLTHWWILCFPDGLWTYRYIGDSPLFNYHLPCGRRKINTCEPKSWYLSHELFSGEH